MAHLRILACLALLAYPHLSRAAHAAAKRFDFKDPKAVNTVVVTLDSLLEPVAAVASGVSGEVEFDPENPKAATGRIVVETSSLRFVNERYTQTALSERGLDAKAHPTITFALKRVRDVRKSGTSGYVGSVDADFTCHGVTKSLTVPLRAAYLPGKARERNRRSEGDLLILRTTFTIKRSDFQIASGVGAELIAEDVEIKAAVVGVSGEAAASPPQPAAVPAVSPATIRSTGRTEGSPGLLRLAAADFSQDALGHLAPGGVAGAEKQHTSLHRWLAPSRGRGTARSAGADWACSGPSRSSS